LGLGPGAADRRVNRPRAAPLMSALTFVQAMVEIDASKSGRV
jgi:hypothetical protein